MKFYSTRDKSLRVSLREAVLNGLSPDGGLYMPEKIPALSRELTSDLAFEEIAEIVSTPFTSEDIEQEKLSQICKSAFNFPVPLVELSSGVIVLELFHGPTLAFKDFGARYMARLMSHFNESESRELTVLVATSGDTGGAVAHGFFQVPGIRVVLLYPSGQVSPLQEKQLTTLGGNITALEVNGNFDDCQKMVKEAFVDQDLNEKLRLTAANSINISRLIPQSLYYASAYSKLGEGVQFAVPSGNFGNLTAGLFLKHMGAKLGKFIGATNVNDTVPRYLETGKYEAKPSKSTISNAMDVGNPSNFERLSDLYGNSHANFLAEIVGCSFTDDETKACMKRVKAETDYTLDPHGAVGYLGIEKLAQGSGPKVLLETAHPAKFHEVVSETLGQKVPIPDTLAQAMNKEKQTSVIDSKFSSLKDFLI